MLKQLVTHPEVFGLPLVACHHLRPARTLFYGSLDAFETSTSEVRAKAVFIEHNDRVIIRYVDGRLICVSTLKDCDFQLCETSRARLGSDITHMHTSAKPVALRLAAALLSGPCSSINWDALSRNFQMVSEWLDAASNERAQIKLMRVWSMRSVDYLFRSSSSITHMCWEKIERIAAVVSMGFTSFRVADTFMDTFVLVHADTVSALIRNASSSQPIFVVLDDREKFEDGATTTYSLLASNGYKSFIVNCGGSHWMAPTTHTVCSMLSSLYFIDVTKMDPVVCQSTPRQGPALSGVYALLFAVHMQQHPELWDDDDFDISSLWTGIDDQCARRVATEAHYVLGHFPLPEQAICGANERDWPVPRVASSVFTRMQECHPGQALAYRRRIAMMRYLFISHIGRVCLWGFIFCMCFLVGVTG